MSLQLPAILSPPTPCIPSPALTVSPLEEVAEVALPFTGRRPVLGFAHPTQARQCIRPYRVQHCFIYGLAVRLCLPPTPSLDDAVTFDYGQPVLCPMATFTPLLMCILRRTKVAPFWRSQVLPVQAARDEIFTAVVHHLEKRFIGLNNLAFQVPDEDPHNDGIDETPNLRFAFLQIAIETRIFERDRGLRREQFQHRDPRGCEHMRGQVIF